MFWFMLLVAWVVLLLRILGDVFRDPDLGGGAKAGWTLLLVLVPWLGVVAYLVVRGSSMTARSFVAAQEEEARRRAYIREAAGASTIADEMRNLAGLRDAGVITAEEYERAKGKVLA